MTRSTINSRSIEGIHSIDATGTVTAAGLTVDTDTLHIDSTNNLVGIGTSSPSAKLETKVSRTSGANVDAIILSDDVTGVQTSGYGTRIVGLSNNGNAKSAIGFEAFGGTNNDTGLGFYTQAVAGGLTRQMTINSIGNVGIGTSSATQRLSVKGTNSTAGQTGADVTMDVYDDSTSGIDVGGAIGFRGNDGINSNVMFGEVSGRKENATSGNYASYMGFKTRANSGGLTERMRIGSSGNVGIGNLNPQFKLHLNNLVTIPSVRYLTDFFGTFEVTAANHHVMISVDDDTSTANPKAVGITLHNESQTDNTFAPAITWGNQSNSGSFSQSTAAIAARRTTQGNDANWHGGELHFYTAVSSGGVGLRTRMIIDDAGRVTKPYQPAFYAYNLNFPGSNATGAASGGTDIVNVGSHYATGTGRFTAPIAGTYVFYMMTQSYDSGNTSGNYQTAIFRKNGTSVGAEAYHGWAPPDGNNHVQAQNTIIITLAANDYMMAYVQYGSRDIQNYFAGYLLG
jgi:hypothetical protein